MPAELQARGTRLPYIGKSRHRGGDGEPQASCPHHALRVPARPH